MMLATIAALAMACTSVKVTPSGRRGALPFGIGRTMELAEADVIMWSYAMHPRLQRWKEGDVKWNNTYGFVSIGAPLMLVNGMALVEGMNEAGFTISALTQRDTVWANTSKTVPNMGFQFLVPYLLGTCKTVEEARERVKKINIVDTRNVNPELFCHWTLSDASGNGLILEYVNGAPVWHNDEFGVLTNDPEYSWHVRNVKNYVALSPTLPATSVVPSLSFGTNLLGLPGDLSPPARFIRMVYLRDFSIQQRPLRTQNDTFVLIQSLLNTVHIVKGTVNKTPKSDATPAEATQWAVVKVPAERKLYLRTYSNMQWRYLDFSRLDFTKAWSFPMDDGTLGIKDVTAVVQQN
eukprot:TRINITY_DN23270_c0_g1_i1.p1 TRINITY_DN23270_c0_g1~~TRINITY_DN23270_c0_g1_i1.p1  ORF type:complete len:367 (+),score=59.41 TRINITY_DN23270_c0_g1_i1:53-1102(+)